MKSYGKAALLWACALAGLTMALAGSAFAGNGNGNGNGNGKGNGGSGAEVTQPSAADAGAGNGNKPSVPPGLEKKDVAPVAAPAAPSAADPPAHQSEAPVASAPAAHDNSSAPGIKPSNTTQKKTSCVTAGSSGNASCASSSSPGKSDASKRYGNGATAAQIVASRGGSGAKLYGPGNSQPHKVAACGRSHRVDVHAVKRYGSGSCDRVSPPSGGGGGSTTPDTPGAPRTPGGEAHPSPSAPANDPGAPSAAASKPKLQGQSEASATRSAKPGVARVLGGVRATAALSATAIAGATLPFTGFPLWLAAVTGLALIASGVVVRRLAPARGEKNRRSHPH